MHMGRGKYIDVEDFYTIASEATSNICALPKLLALHLFGKDVLLKSIGQNKQPF